MRERSFCENDRKSDFFEKEIISSIIFTKRTPPAYENWIFGNILSKGWTKLEFCIILMKRSHPHMKIGLSGIL